MDATATYSDPRPESKIGKVRSAVMYLLDGHRIDGALPTSVRFLFYELVMQRVVTNPEVVGGGDTLFRYTTT